MWIERHPSCTLLRSHCSGSRNLCRWHVPPDDVAPELTHELRVFKDADALDRWRIHDLDPRLLRTRIAHTLLTASQELWSVTADVVSGGEAFEQVIEAAVKIGVLRDE
jgi:hypothetical protein